MRAHNLVLSSTFNNAEPKDFEWRTFRFTEWTQSEDFQASRLHEAHDKLEKEEKNKLFDFLVAKLGYDYKNFKERARVLEKIYYQDQGYLSNKKILRRGKVTYNPAIWECATTNYTLSTFNACIKRKGGKVPKEW